MTLDDDGRLSGTIGELLGPRAMLVAPAEVAFTTDMTPHRASDFEPGDFTLLDCGGVYVQFVETYPGRPREGSAGLILSEPIEAPKDLMVTVPGFQPYIVSIEDIGAFWIAPAVVRPPA